VRIPSKIGVRCLQPDHKPVKLYFGQALLACPQSFLFGQEEPHYAARIHVLFCSCISDRGNAASQAA
jgi:hypothetical protein